MCRHNPGLSYYMYTTTSVQVISNNYWSLLYKRCFQKPHFFVVVAGRRLPVGSVLLFHTQPSSDTTMRQLGRSKPTSVGLCVA